MLICYVSSWFVNSGVEINAVKRDIFCVATFQAKEG